MSACCVSGCKNRHSLTSKLKFYRIPSGYRLFQANRRRLWLQAIQKVNGSAEELKGNARICGAHFISGEASMDVDNPDFVPSVFTCTKQSPSNKTKLKWVYGRRKRQYRKASMKEEGKTTQSAGDAPMKLKSSVLMEETQTPSSPLVPKESGTLTEGDETETETKTFKPQTTSSPNKVSPFKLPAGIPDLGKMIPTLLLKPVFVPAGGYQCELCDQSFPNASQLLKHKQLHEEEKLFICESCGKLFRSQADFTEHQHTHEFLFQCNICDRSFNTSQNLKRHKLLHVKDGRRCHKCGTRYCRLHNHVLFLPQTKSETDSSITESLLDKPEPKQSFDLDDATQSNVTVTQLQTTKQAASFAPQNPALLSKTHNALPPASYTRIISEIPLPVLKKPYPVPRPPSPVPSFFRNYYLSAFTEPSLAQQPELPPSLQMFSPQYLTSALLDVKRNYEYILSKSGVVINKNTVKEEPRTMTPQDQHSVVEHNKNERIAYDLEIVL
uniref:zinc finger protein 236-like isoform X1 n=1 Tax=Scatophagus argus TaxID=75038 RepID=UPI001ED81299|nr:zinc finger protein 236-like isoform X1 [Scatophagus argus]